MSFYMTILPKKLTKYIKYLSNCGTITWRFIRISIFVFVTKWKQLKYKKEQFIGAKIRKHPNVCSKN